MLNKNFKRLSALILAGVLFTGTLTACSSNSEAVAAAKAEGVAALTEQDYETAIEKFDEALEAAGSKVGAEEFDICYYKAAAQYAMKDYEGAINTYEALLSYDKNDADPAYLQGCLYASEQEIEHALSSFDEAVSREPDNYELYINIYENLTALGYEEEAEDYLNQAMEISGDKGTDYLYRGRIYMLLSQYDAAEVQLNKAVEASEYEGYAYLCRLYDATGDITKADDQLTLYKACSGLEASDYAAIAKAELSRGDYASALTDVQTALDAGGADSDDEREMLEIKISCLEKQGSYEEALEIAQEFIEQYPDSQEMLREITFLTVLTTDYDADDTSGEEAESAEEE